MKRTHLRVLLAGLLALSLTACSSFGWKGFSNPFSSGSNAAPPASNHQEPAKPAPANGAGTTEQN